MSPRNRAIWATYGQQEKHLVSAILGSAAVTTEPTSTKRPFEVDVFDMDMEPIQKRPRTIRQSEQTSRQRFELEQTLKTLDPTLTVEDINQRVEAVRRGATERSGDMTVYNNYKSHLLSSKLYCRVFNHLEATYALPDIDEFSGRFKASKFIHVTRKMLEPTTGDDNFQPRYGCTCAIYHTLAHNIALDDITQERTDNLCVHTRLLHDHLPESADEEWSDNGISQKLKEVCTQSQSPVVIVDEDTDCTKYSVVVDSEVSFVHISRNSGTGRRVVHCKVNY